MVGCKNYPPKSKPHWPYKGGRIGSGWAPEEPEDEVQDLAVGLLKGTLDKIFGLIKQRNQERQNAIEEIKKQKSLLK